MFTSQGGLFRVPACSVLLSVLSFVAYAQVPSAEFEATPTIGGSPLTVNFTDLSTGTVSTWNWSFGNTNGSVLQHPLATYLSPGTFTVSLTVSGPGGSDNETKSDYIIVIGPTMTGFIAAPLSGVAPLTVSFTDTTTPPATSWSWSFGDGGVSTDQNPIHTYQTHGAYTVSLTAIGAGGADTETKSDFIDVLQAASASYRNGGTNPPCYLAPPPIIGTTWIGEVDSTPLPGAIVTVIMVRSEPIDGVNTVFGCVLINPGSNDLVTSILPASGGIDLHSFPLPNEVALIGRPGYTQALLVGTGGTGQFCNAADLVAGAQPQIAPPEVGFAAMPTSGDVPLSVAFTDQSSGVISAWTWDFGDGTSSTQQHPTHIYAAGGSHAVSLVVEGPGGFDVRYVADFIVVADPIADFSAAPLTGSVPLVVAFTDLSVGTVTSWSWDFGDSGSSTQANPTHTYAIQGVYTVSLTVAGPLGSSTETKSDYIVAGANPPVAEFSGTPLAGDAPLLVNFSDLSTGAVSAWSWDFGDSQTSTLQHPTHTYAAAGTYTVSLTATGPGGSDLETKLDYVTVAIPPPVAVFNGTPTSGVVPLSVDFRDLSLGQVSAWSWDLGDTTTSMVQNPSHIYTTAGTYTVSLTATGPGGSSLATSRDLILVAPQLPFAQFVGTPTAGEAPLTVAFSDLSLGPLTSWSWDFGDGGSSTLQEPTHTYVTLGTYTVSLTVGSTLGTDVRIKTDYITTKPGLFLDGSFELQTPGLAPDAPWTVVAGSGHVIQPDGGAVADNGLPSEGVQWAEVTGSGSSGALPPSNPGGLGSLPQGAAGFEQVFLFDPSVPVLVFRAAFLLGGTAASVATNDFMSVDITFDTISYNLYYADTFADFSNTSLRHGLPMTAVQDVGANLATLFPAAFEGSIFTLAVQVGNGGDGNDASLGYVDDFSLRDPAGVVYRNGSGVNPPCYVAGPPIVGATWSPTVDHRDRPGATFAMILLRQGPLPPLPLGFGELLVNTTIYFDTVHLADPSGITTFSIPIPNDPALMSMAASQGLILGLPTPLLCNALDLRIGLAPTEAVPQAAFFATPTLGTAPLSVTFADATVGPVTSWNWDFGDTGTSTQQHAAHVYTTPGSYTVHLRATGPGGLDIERKFDFIQVQ